MKKKDALLTTLLVILSSCSTLDQRVERPHGPVCLHYVGSVSNPCTDILDQKESWVNHTDTDGWLMMPTATWKDINRYIDDIKKLIDQKGRVVIRRKDLDKIYDFEMPFQILQDMSAEAKGKR